jgi:hypothetical protein
MQSRNNSDPRCTVRTLALAGQPLARYPRRAALALILTAATLYRSGARAETPAGEPTPGPRAIAVFGDSQAEGLAAGLRRVARQMPGTKIQNHTKAGTAISQVETYDWPAVIQDYQPDPTVTTAVLMFGGNDRVPMHPPNAAAIPFRTPAWNEAYHSRVAAILHSLADKKLRVIWVSQPICRDARYSNDMAYLNTIFHDEAASGNAIYLDIWTAIADGDQYAAYGKALDGTTARLRLDDGIHFTPGGYDILATKVMQAIADAPK